MIAESYSSADGIITKGKPVAISRLFLMRKEFSDFADGVLSLEISIARTGMNIPPALAGGMFI